MGAGLGLLGNLSLASCQKPEEPIMDTAYGDEPFEYIDPKLAKQVGTFEWAASGAWRTKQDKARDKYRHPLQLLRFFEVRSRSKVLDFWPGAGYMTEILAPYLNKQKGVYTAALFPENAHNFPEVKAISDRFRGHFAGNKKNYGDIKLTQFGPETRDIVPLESQDVVLFLLVLQDWMAAGIAEKAFVEAFAALKSGGILGVEQHRSDIGNVQDPAASNGYVQEPFVKQLASEAGFVFVQSSEMNANPKDGKEHPFGVWTLPPQRLSAPRGQAPNPNFNSGIYESIGESDRMVLKFRKP
jgi:predicted methyltransferase